MAKLPFGVTIVNLANDVVAVVVTLCNHRGGGCINKAMVIVVTVEGGSGGDMEVCGGGIVYKAKGSGGGDGIGRWMDGGGEGGGCNGDISSSSGVRMVVDGGGGCGIGSGWMVNGGGGEGRWRWWRNSGAHSSNSSGDNGRIMVEVEVWYDCGGGGLVMVRVTMGEWRDGGIYAGGGGVVQWQWQ
ncbi:hypothetical protein Acr_12g0002630 [Actinidia rufa]|uniref:Uncharacterized protein n=1 Tax=Actinidia rufa TaxID=165716 RepID=A0A7J0FG94_9ERIC|nr:hypothetical protein Acr_12g0002630 [Actinidia rufa]